MALKLLTISHMYPSRYIPRHGIFLQRQAEFLKQYGIECSFVVPRPWSPWPLSMLARSPVYANNNPLLGTDAHEVPFMRLPGYWFKRFEAKQMTKALLAETRSLHQQNQFDAIWACPVIADGYSALPLRRALSLPQATLAIGSDIMVLPQDPVLRVQVQQVLAESDLLVGVSKAICDRMRDLAPCSPLQVFLGRDTSMFRPVEDRAALREHLDIPQDAIVATYVGLVASTKGISELCVAMRALLANDRLHLLCVGDGPALGQLRELASDRIHLVGEQPPEQIPKYLQAADFFVFPSHSEGMPQAVLEAMHCGLPIVATDVGGTGEAVDDGDNGFLVAAGRADLLEDAMRRMINDEDFRIRAATRSLEIAAGRFDSESHAQRLATALERMVAEAKTP